MTAGGCFSMCLRCCCRVPVCVPMQAAWGLNRHSVVEVITDRTTNVELHRVVQVGARNM